jgi:hypothetical protein
MNFSIVALGFDNFWTINLVKLAFDIFMDLTLAANVDANLWSLNWHAWIGQFIDFHLTGLTHS